MIEAQVSLILFRYLQLHWPATISAPNVLSSAPLKLFVRLGFCLHDVALDAFLV